MSLTLLTASPACGRGPTGLALLVGTLFAFVPRTATAQMEWNTGLVGGVCGVGERSAVWDRSRACLGARADWVLGREGPGEMGAGWFVQTTTAGFRDVAFEGGGVGLLPMGRTWTTLLSAGPLVRLRDGEWEPGVAGWVFIGSRGFNYHGRYNMAWGVVSGYERGLSERGTSALTIGIQLDGLVLALPVMFAIDAIRGGRR